MNLSRRGLLTGLTAFLAAPAIVRAGSLMPVKAWNEPMAIVGYTDWGLGHMTGKFVCGEQTYAGDLVRFGSDGKIYRIDNYTTQMHEYFGTVYSRA